MFAKIVIAVLVASALIPLSVTAHEGSSCVVHPQTSPLDCSFTCHDWGTRITLTVRPDPPTGHAGSYGTGTLECGGQRLQCHVGQRESCTETTVTYGSSVHGTCSAYGWWIKVTCEAVVLGHQHAPPPDSTPCGDGVPPPTAVNAPRLPARPQGFCA